MQIKIMKEDTLVEFVPMEELAEELKDYVNRARYKPLKAKEVLSIIYDETELFFNGDKSLEAVREVIQNRVQLYLDENM